MKLKRSTMFFILFMMVSHTIGGKSRNFLKSISFRRDKVDFVELVSLMYILLLMKCVLEFNLYELKLSSFLMVSRMIGEKCSICDK